MAGCREHTRGSQRGVRAAHWVVLVWLACWAGTAGGQVTDENPLRSSPFLPPTGQSAPSEGMALPAASSSMSDPGSAATGQAAGPTSAIGGGLAIGPAVVNEPPAAQAAAHPTAQPSAVTPAVEAASQPPAAAKLSRETVQAQMDLLQNATDLEEGAKAELLKRYKTALDWLVGAEEARQKAAQYDQEVAQAPQAIQSAKERLATAPDPGPGVPHDATLQQMEQLLGEAEAALQKSSENLARREDELKRRGERKTELAKLLEETSQRLEDTRKQVVAPPAAGEAPTVAAARRAEVEARILALEAQAVLYKSEAKRHDAIAELLPLQRDLAKRNKTSREKEVANLQKLVAARRQVESERQARQLRREVENAHPALRQLAERNAALAEERKLLAGSISKTSGEVRTIEKQLAQLDADFESLQAKIMHAGHSSSIGLVLRNRRGTLPNPHEAAQRIRFVADEMPEANLERMELEEERSALGDLDAATQASLTSLEALPGTNEEYLRDTVHELLTTKRDLLDKLVADYDTYLTELTELEVSTRKLQASSSRFADYIDEHVLWIRSAEAFRPRDLATALSGLIALASPGPWWELATQCGLDTWREPLTALPVLLLVLVLIGFHTHLRIRMRNTCSAVSGSTSIRFWPTAEALSLAAILAAEWPIVIAFFGWQMSTAPGESALGQSLGVGLQHAALLLWVSEFTRQVSRVQGVGETIFNWSSHSLRTVRRHLGWLTYLALPLAVVVAVAQQYREGEWNNSVGRLAFMIAMLMSAGFMHALLGSKEHILRETVAREPKGLLARCRGLCHLLGVLVPLALALLALVGYYYSAQQLAVRFQQTVAVVLALVLSHAVLSRWFLIKRRRRALEQLRQRQSQDSDNTNSCSIVVPPRADAQQLTQLHEQLRYMLRHAVAVAFLVCGWIIWSDVLPALKALDNHVLWWSTVEVVEMHENADGTLERQRIENDVPTTLRHALFACLLLVAAIVSGRHLPALLEITLLERLPLDRGARHAICVIFRYGLALGGVILACRTMSITWTSVQWLAAGMTVGLGFGLQEIFANFVSGLILLFERPIRVGDVITLGDVTGTVTNIRIRATTVTDWDRKELIVPNKDLVTGRMLNWTLSDTLSRITLNVGISYDSDTTLARETILDIAQRHSNVLPDPAPNVTFQSFGDSTLNFVLRCYVATMDARLDTIHDLHATIHREFREKGIDIAFPQRVVNIRSIDSLAHFVRSSDEREAAAA